ncbi:MAG: heterodisulfide reductase subunit C [Salibacteraceae bacterium]|jgi:heterodisulfide reductase subunit C
MAIGSILFIIFLGAAFFLFYRSIRKIRRNILLGRDVERTDNPSLRWKTTLRVALGQSKMVVRPVAGFLHILVYAGFVIINIEILEIIIDGVFGTHRIFSSWIGVDAYRFFINCFEILALLVLLACVVFLLRRNVVKIARFWNPEMKGWPTSDANLILIAEILLMSAFLTMDAADVMLMQTSAETLASAGLDKYAINWSGSGFTVSSLLIGLLPSDIGTLHIIERFCWWFHILGILAFLNYLAISKHLHIILAFPAVYFSNLKAKGEFDNLESVKNEVELMFDPSIDPYAAPPEPDENAVPIAFGAKDVKDLSWKQLMDSYTCTECGRCTSECPANQTGKLLSPRKIMMDTRDRLTELGNYIDKNGLEAEDDKTLINDYITPEELWACTSCNACTEACPINLDPLSIIVDLRRYLVMEQSAAPAELNNMFTNIENNGAPWQFAQADRLNWKDE